VPNVRLIHIAAATRRGTPCPFRWYCIARRLKFWLQPQGHGILCACRLTLENTKREGRGSRQLKQPEKSVGPKLGPRELNEKLKLHRVESSTMEFTVASFIKFDLRLSISTIKIQFRIMAFQQRDIIHDMVSVYIFPIAQSRTCSQNLYESIPTKFTSSSYCIHICALKPYSDMRELVEYIKRIPLDREIVAYKI
jgi:hypothetical protein